MVVKALSKISSKVFDKLVNKFFITFLLFSILPVLALGLYFIYEANDQVEAIIFQNRDKLIEKSLDLQVRNLENHARWIDLNLEKIKDELRDLRIYTEHLLDHRYHYPSPPRKTEIIQHPEGYYYSSPNNLEEIEISNIFISSTAQKTPELEDKLNMTRYLEPVFEGIIENNENLVAVYFLLPESALRIYPKLDFPTLIDEEHFPSDLIIEDYPFYYTALPQHNPQKDVAITEIYKDITHRGLMLTFNLPIRTQDGTLQGVIGVDMTVDKIVDSILSYQIEHDGTYAFLLTHTDQVIGSQLMDPSQTGRVQAASEQGLLIQDYMETPYGELIFQSENNNCKSEISSFFVDGREEFALSVSLPNNDWSMGYIIPAEEILRPLKADAAEQIAERRKEILINMLMAILMCLLSAGFLSVLVANEVTKPLLDLTKGAEKMANGEFHHLTGIKRNDELGLLTFHFNRMSSKLEELVSDLKQRTKEKEQLSEKLFENNKSLEKKVLERTSKLKDQNYHLNEAFKEIRDLEKSRRLLLSNVSHELKTPLTMLVGYVEALHDGFPSDEAEFNHYLAIIHQQSKRLDRLIKDLIDLSNIESGQSIVFEQVHSFDFFSQYFDELTFFMEQQHRAFSYNLPQNLPLIYIDAERIIQALNNLVHNAIRHTPEKGRIHISVEPIGTDLLVKIIDNGYGIHESEINNIFKRFYKGRNPTSQPASSSCGLGLAIAKEIIEAHQGVIWVQSMLGKGTKFLFTIPFDQ